MKTILGNFFLRFDIPDSSISSFSVFPCRSRPQFSSPTDFLSKTDSCQGNRITEEIGNHICSGINSRHKGRSQSGVTADTHAFYLLLLHPITLNMRFCETIGGHNAIFRSGAPSFLLQCWMWPILGLYLSLSLSHARLFTLMEKTDTRSFRLTSFAKGQRITVVNTANFA